MTNKYVLVISGAPASGKSTLAGGLARALPAFALLQKDPIKEALFEELTAAERGAEGCSRRLSHAATNVLWALARGCPRAILEANFRTLDPEERDRLRALDGHTLEVHCVCPYEAAVRRFAERAPSRHGAHTLHTLSPALFAEFAQPFALCPVIEVDTSERFDLSGVLARVQSHWPEVFRA